MSGLAGAMLFALSILALPASAHDIGVSRSELVETPAGDTTTYRLRVAAGPGATARFSTPELPDHCEFVGDPRGVQGAGWKSFEFRCAGGLTPDDSLSLPWRRDGVMMTARWADGSEVRRLFKYESGAIIVPMAELRVGSGSWQAAAKRYTVLGVDHILVGYDHLLFVLALLLIVRSGWMLVKTITAFTVAHSITLALATLGFVNVASRPVEAAIALSIVFLALEILAARRGQIGLTYRKPWLVAFGFGLLHGFGFAGALSEIGLPQSEIPVALLFFNVGVEFGQLLFIAGVLILRSLWSQLAVPLPRQAALVPAYLIGTIATYWLLERVGGMVLPA